MGKTNISRTYKRRSATDVVNSLFARNITKRKTEKIKRKKKVKKAFKRIDVSELPPIDHNHHLLNDSFNNDSPVTDMFDHVKQTEVYNHVNYKPVVKYFSSGSEASKLNKTNSLPSITIINPTPVKRERRPRKVITKKNNKEVLNNSKCCIHGKNNSSEEQKTLDKSVNVQLSIEKRQPENVRIDSLNITCSKLSLENDVLGSLIKLAEPPNELNEKFLDNITHITSTPLEPFNRRQIDHSCLSPILSKSKKFPSESVGLSSIDCSVEKTLDEIKKWDYVVPDFNYSIPRNNSTPKRKTNRKKEIYWNPKSQESIILKDCYVKLTRCVELEQRIDFKLNCSPFVKLDRVIDILGINGTINLKNSTCESSTNLRVSEKLKSKPRKRRPSLKAHKKYSFCYEVDSLYKLPQEKTIISSNAFSLKKKLRKKYRKVTYNLPPNVSKKDIKQPLVLLTPMHKLETTRKTRNNRKSSLKVKNITTSIYSDISAVDKEIYVTVNDIVKTTLYTPIRSYITTRRKINNNATESPVQTPLLINNSRQNECYVKMYHSNRLTGIDMRKSTSFKNFDADNNTKKQSVCPVNNDLSKPEGLSDTRRILNEDITKLLQSPLSDYVKSKWVNNHERYNFSSDLFDSEPEYSSPKKGNNNSIAQNKTKSHSISKTDYVDRYRMSPSTKSFVSTSTQTDDLFMDVSKSIYETRKSSAIIIENTGIDVPDDSTATGTVNTEDPLAIASRSLLDAKITHRSKEKKITEDVIDLSNSFCSNDENDDFVMPMVPLKNLKPPSMPVIKPGKSYKRSLSFFRRSSSQLLNAPVASRNGGSCGSLVSNVGKTRDSSSRRRLSKVSLSQEFRGFPRNGEDLLESFAVVSTGIIPNNTENETLEEKFGRISVNEPHHNDQEIDDDNDNDAIVITQPLPKQIAPICAKDKAKAVVFEKCRQTEPLPFSECYPDSILQHCFKIGEGVFGEVFQFRGENGKPTVMKIIPIEGSQVVNGEVQKKFEEIMTEIVIVMELSSLRNNNINKTSTFSELQRVRCVKGRWPARLLDLWDLYDEDRKSENDSPEVFGEDQLYIVLELANGGRDLEAFTFTNALQAFSVFQQVSCALAVAEESLEFEHRDLHWGNVLVSIVDRDQTVNFVLNGKTITLETFGVEASIIDFTLSRITKSNCCIFTDVSNDLELFNAQGDYQFEIYRLMKKRNGNEWENFEPYTNVLWLHYLLDKAVTALRYRSIKSKLHKEYIRKLGNIKDVILKYTSAKDYVINNFQF